jgi:hypothetical protein
MGKNQKGAFMAEKAILVYGLTKDEAVTAAETLSQSLEYDVDLFSATTHDSMTVNDVVNDYPEQVFESRDVRFVMFLGVNDNKELELLLKAYPKEQRRPIFCTLTESNRYWTVDNLAAHLAEEHRQATAAR